MTDSRKPNRRSVLAHIGASAIFAAGALIPSGLASGQTPVDPREVLHARFLQRLQLRPEQEVRLGAELNGAMVALSGGPYLNRTAQAALEDFAQPLFFATSRPLFTWKVTLIDNETPCAWALPGGRIGIHKGLLRYVDTPDQLAAIIGHEMAHTELGHLLAAIRSKTFADDLPSAAAELVLTEIQGKDSAGLLSRTALRVLATPLFGIITSGYGIEREYEADRQMVRLLRQTGYNPQLGMEIFKTVARLVPDGTAGTTCLYAGPGTEEARQSLVTDLSSQGTLGATTTFSNSFEDLKAIFPTRRHFRLNGPKPTIDSASPRGLD